MGKLNLIFRSHPSSISSPSTSKTNKDGPKKGQRTYVERPQQLVPGSLHYALVNNLSKYLWADPLAWHAGHLEVLNCPEPFSTRPPAPPISPRDNDYPTDTKKTYDTLYSQWHLPDTRNMYLREIFSGVIQRKKYALGLTDAVVAKRGDDLSLYYGGIAAAKLSAHLIVWDRGVGPILAYLDPVWLRQSRINFWLSRNPSKPRDLRKHFLSRDQASIEPYFVALMISMAQTLFHQTLSNGSQQSSFQVHILFPTRNSDYLVRFSSDISKKYLMKFESPHEFHDARLEMTRTELPIGNNVAQIGDVIEGLLNHDIPVQSHPPFASFHFRDATSKRKRETVVENTEEVAGDKTKEVGSPSLKADKDKHASKRRLSVGALEEL